MYVKSEIMDGIAEYDVTLVPGIARDWYVVDDERRNVLVITDDGAGSFGVIEPDYDARLSVTFATINTLASAVQSALAQTDVLPKP